MINDCLLRPIKRDDHPILRAVYSDAIESQGNLFYTKEQIQAWSVLAWLPGVMDQAFAEGKGWLVASRETVEAFAIRYPSPRLALVYSRGRSTRLGYATKLIAQIEQDALAEGIRQIFTEASLFSYPLFLKHGWTNDTIENILIGGVPFTRFRMSKLLS